MKKLFSRRVLKNKKQNSDPKHLNKNYRSYVGQERFYDVIAAMSFNLLTCLGLRQEHKIIDIGCGSLRVGRLLIPYLNKNNYYGVEPNKWLVQDGIKNEVGRDLIKIKAPTFIFDSSISEAKLPTDFDFVIAQSIFSHCGRDLVGKWLSEIQPHLKNDGALLATFKAGEADPIDDGWFYPHAVEFKIETMAAMASHHGFEFEILDWRHPRQTWALFAKKDFDKSLINGAPIHWNRVVNRIIS